MDHELIGEIDGLPPPRGPSKRRWIDLIREHPGLAPDRPREVINPFTRAPMLLQPRRDAALVVIEGEEVGSMAWAEGNSNRIRVYGDRQAVEPLAREVAERLGGRFREVADEADEGPDPEE